MAIETKKSFKVVKFRIDKVTGQMQWREFTRLLYDVRYRVFRLANLVVSEKYLGFHLFRTGKAEKTRFRLSSCFRLSLTRYAPIRMFSRTDIWENNALPEGT